MHHPPTRAYILPRAFKQRGRLFSGLLDALAQGADPRKLEVEDGSGGWKPYVEAAQVAPQDRLARKVTMLGRSDGDPK